MSVILLLLSSIVSLDYIRHGPKNQLLCQCGRYYNTANRLMLHQREECQDFKRFQCDYCLKWFKRRSHLNRHKKLHKADYDNFKQKLPTTTTPITTTTTSTAKSSRSRTSSRQLSAFDPMDLYPSDIRVENEADFSN